MKNISLLKYAVASMCLSLALMGNAYAAAYLKYEGIKGEAEDVEHGDWIEVLSVEVSQGRLIVTLSNGEKKWLRETGTYRFDDGRLFYVRNGQVIKHGRTVPRTVAPDLQPGAVKPESFGDPDPPPKAIQIKPAQ